MSGNVVSQIFSFALHALDEESGVGRNDGGSHRGERRLSFFSFSIDSLELSWWSRRDRKLSSEHALRRLGDVAQRHESRRNNEIDSIETRVIEGWKLLGTKTLKDIFGMKRAGDVDAKIRIKKSQQVEMHFPIRICDL